jgi:hypothetical protein
MEVAAGAAGVRFHSLAKENMHPKANAADFGPDSPKPVARKSMFGLDSPLKASSPTSPIARQDESSPRSAGMFAGPSTTAGESTLLGDVQGHTNSTLGTFGITSHSTQWRHSQMTGGDHSVSIMKKSGGDQRGLKSDMAFVKIRTVLDIYKAVRILVGMVANCWTGFKETTSFQQSTPGLLKVHVGDKSHILPGFLLQDMESMLIRERPTTQQQNSKTSAPVTTLEATCKMNTQYFKQIVLLLKLRWLLRLHSACCELDYKMCSFGSLIKGLQLVSVQQCAEVESDSVFDKKVNANHGSHVNMESILDDVFDQLQRALGNSWRSFIEFASTCDPTRSVHHSRMDMGPLQVIPNHQLMVMIDTIFVATCLRMRREAGTDLKGCFDHLALLGIPLPELPPLRQAQNLRLWAKAKTKPTRQDRDRANKKDMEKLAQLDVVLLCAAMELQSPEILATAEELREMQLVTTHLPKNMSGDVAPEPTEFGATGTVNPENAPSAARVCLIDKPQVSPAIFNAVVNAVHHHVSFPHGIRERLYKLMAETYGLTREQSERLAIALTQNIDGSRLSTGVLYAMRQREQLRLRNHEVENYSDCSHLLKSALVAAPAEHLKPAKYTLPPKPSTAPAGSEFSKSLPSLRFAGDLKKKGGGVAFKVPLSTGPLTMDPDLNKLRSTGYFIKMPSLKGQ